MYQIIISLVAMFQITEFMFRKLYMLKKKDNYVVFCYIFNKNLIAMIFVVQQLRMRELNF